MPDASFISRQRQPTLPKEFKVMPELAMEVVSPSNRPRDLLNKVETYLEDGTITTWVVYPDERVVDVFRRDNEGRLIVQKVEYNGTLDGAEVLPGFQLAVSGIFPPE